MIILKKSSIFFMLVIGMLFVSSCSLIGGDNAKAQASGIQALTPAQLLQKSANVMKQLRSVSFNLNADNTTSLPSTAGRTQKISITMKGTGVQIQPNQAQLQLSMGLGSTAQTLKIAEVITSKKLYIQSQKGRWFILDKSGPGTAGNPLSSADVSNYNNLLHLTNNTKLKDDGTTILNRARLRHLTLTFGKDSLKDLLNTTGSLNSLPAGQQQNINKVLQGITMKNTVLDLWIDAATGYIHRLQLQFDLSIDLSKLVTSTRGASSSTPMIIGSKANVIIDYSKFNDGSLRITVPSNATPTTSILNAFA